MSVSLTPLNNIRLKQLKYSKQSQSLPKLSDFKQKRRWAFTNKPLTFFNQQRMLNKSERTVNAWPSTVSLLQKTKNQKLEFKPQKQWIYHPVSGTWNTQTMILKQQTPLPTILSRWAPKTTGGTRPNNKTVDRTPIPKTNNNQQLITLQYPIRWDTSRRTSRSVYQQSGKDNESPLAVIRNTRRLSDSITQETISMEIEENSPQYLGTASSERRYKQVFDSGHYRNFTNSVKQLPFNFFHYTRKKKKKKKRH
ncbi:hypothetical protein G6F65_011018 [Rhizopus arrhizus]|nr:hypothetical protein G6F65_011018 [Rhizopus arrhizus]